MNKKHSTKWRQSGTSPRATRILRLLAAVLLLKLVVILALFVRPQFPDLMRFGHATKPQAAVATQPVPVLGVEEAHAAQNPAAPVPAAAPEAAPQPLNRESLQKRQEELDRREQSLKTLEANLDAKLADLKTLEAKLEKMLSDADALKDEKLRHLVDVYSNMKAKQAAQVLETLDETIAVKILAGMRGRQAGEILSNVNPQKAAVLSEALTRMQMPFDNK